MASTRISNDRLRIYKDLQQSTDVGRDVLKVPGNGLDIPMINDPHIRMQKWGANHVNDIISVDNSLKNIDRPLMRGCRDCKKSYYTNPDLSSMTYSQDTFGTIDSFITQPAWELRDKENTRALGFPEANSDANLFLPFTHDLGTRMLEKDLYCKNKK